MVIFKSIQSLYDQSQSCIKLNSIDNVEAGVKQGDSISSLLLNIFSKYTVIERCGEKVFYLWKQLNMFICLNRCCSYICIASPLNCIGYLDFN